MTRVAPSGQNVGALTLGASRGEEAAGGRSASMFRHRIALGRVLGITIGLDYSWFLIFALLSWTLAVSYYPEQFSGWSSAEYWLLGALSAVLLFAGVLLHELGHSVVALRWKVPVRSITLFIFGGVAEIGEQPPTAAAEFWIAVAGPVVSLALAVAFALLTPLLAGAPPLLALATYLAYVNGALFLFNLVPGFPLDGGRVLRAMVWGATGSLRKATVIAGNVGRFIGFGFILLGVWRLLEGNFVGGMWIMLIGWFLESAAMAQIHLQQTQNILAGYRVSNAMSRDYLTVPADESLQHLVDERILGGGSRCFIVVDAGEVAGLLTLHHVREVERTEWPATTVARVMVPLSRMSWIDPQAGLWAALKKMNRDGVNQLPVLSDGALVGILRREDLIRFMQTVQELDARGPRPTSTLDRGSGRAEP